MIISPSPWPVRLFAGGTSENRVRLIPLSMCPAAVQPSRFLRCQNCNPSIILNVISSRLGSLILAEQAGIVAHDTIPDGPIIASVIGDQDCFAAGLEHRLGSADQAHCLAMTQGQ